MCQINNVLHNTGNKPLICYKVLFRDLEGISSLYFSSCSWKLKETKSLKQLSPHIDNCIGEGFFHAFPDKVDAYQEQISMSIIHPSENYIIAKMEIPPHTNYYAGITETGIDSIATRVITFKQIL